MTITSEAARVSYTASGNSSFAYTWRILDDDDLLVVLTSSAGVETTQTINTNYTVTGVGDASGGTIEFVSAPTATDTVAIILDPPRTQLLDFSGGAVPLLSLETALDSLLNVVKRCYDFASRALQLSDGGTSYDADSAKIVNLTDPTADQDAATKAYVDAEIAAATLDPTTPVTAYAATLLDDANAAAARTTLGATSLGSSLFTSTDGQDAMQQMGIAAVLALILDTAPDVPTLIDLLDIPDIIPEGTNLLINPDFKIWQTGTSRTSVTTFPNNDDTYFADQWVLLSNGNDQVDITNSATLFGYPTGALGLAEFDVEGAAKWGFMQIVESAQSVPLRGKTVKVSFSSNSNSGLRAMRCHLVSWSTAFSANVVTSDVVSAWEAAATKPTAIANVTLVDADDGSTFNCGASAWTDHVFTFTVPADAINVGVFICTNDAAYSIGDKVGFSAFQLTQIYTTTPVATPFYSRPVGEELALCERFYEKTFALATTPAQNVASDAGALHCQVNGQGSGNPRGAAFWNFKQRKMRVPTVTTYNPNAAAATWDEVGGAGTLTATVSNEGENGAFVYTAASGSSTDVSRYSIHATADARL